MSISRGSFHLPINNNPPVSSNDSYNVEEDTTLIIAAPGVLDNDSDIDGDNLTSVKVSDPSHGALTLNSDGSFTYTPSANYNGSDSFTYKANDGTSDSNVATVTITVTSAKITANVKIEPETLNLGSRGVFTAFIKLPDGYSVSDINMKTVVCYEATATKGSTSNGKDTYIAKFNVQDLVGVPTGDAVVLTVTGEVSGICFEGSDTIRVTKQGKKAPSLAIFSLEQNFPNPFNPETWIPYQLHEASEVSIRIHNVAGELVREIKLGYKPAGIYTSQDRSAYWDGTNNAGERVSSGVYFYNIQAGKYTATMKMIVTK